MRKLQVSFGHILLLLKRGICMTCGHANVNAVRQACVLIGEAGSPIEPEPMQIADAATIPDTGLNGKVSHHIAAFSVWS